MDGIESSIAKTRIQVTLVLGEKHAKWLRGLVQNPIHCSNCQKQAIEGEEPLDERDMRHDFFKALERV